MHPKGPQKVQMVKYMLVPAPLLVLMKLTIRTSLLIWETTFAHLIVHKMHHRGHQNGQNSQVQAGTCSHVDLDEVYHLGHKSLRQNLTVKVMTTEKKGISEVVVVQTIICHWLEVSNRQGNYPFTYLMT